MMPSGDESSDADAAPPEGAAVPAKPACLGCGLMLPPEPEGELCRRCMFPLVASLQDAGQAFAAAGQVNADVFCHQCGYNLRGLARDGRCPECATLVGVSLQHDLLCFAEPGYVRKLTWGNRLAGWGWLSLLIFVFGLLGMVFLFTFSAAPATGDEQFWLGLCFGGLVIAAFLGGWLLLMVGAWLLTARQPQVFVPTGRLKARQVVRYFLISVPLGAAVYFGLGSVAPSQWVRLGLILLLLALASAGVVAVIALFRCLEGTARRVPDSTLARRARRIGNELGIALGTLVGLTLLLMTVRWLQALLYPPPFLPGVTATNPAPPNRPISPAVAGPGILGSLLWMLISASSCVTTVCWIYLVVLALRARGWHVQMQQRLTRHLAFAEQHWARGGACKGDNVRT